MKPPLKYRNEPTTVDGISFASKREAKRWQELKLLERAGEISYLDRQKPMQIVVNGVKVCKYIPDATYVNLDGENVVEDTKSPATRKNPVYRLKKKLVKAVFGIDILET